ncbi:MFS transporter [Sphingomonas sp. H160509]|uniref:MFS transporter n=1 Tax=Sphingomonas sp. H160509 TaxID=2955313 RepID=UPI0020970DF2|nr:MFS transporter [Sphingomonas sp. H160509]MDD1449980.1 MFS transporter [Sphingomonas sp. H160509]
MLDWGALLLSGKGLLPVTQAGLGYSVFAVAMTAGRLTGDAIVARLGDRRTMMWGGLLSIVGYGVMLLAPIASVALLGFLLIGLGASNVVPILFRQAGAQTVIPAGLAIAAVTTIGYAGILAGPAAIGFVAQGIGLPAAFWLLTALLCLVPLCAKAATANRRTS